MVIKENLANNEQGKQMLQMNVECACEWRCGCEETVEQSDFFLQFQQPLNIASVLRTTEGFSLIAMSEVDQ